MSEQMSAAVDPLPEIRQDLFCQTCGYNLRGLTGNRCPECGGSLDGVRSLVPQIPWVYRKETGWFRAYWRTVWFVMFRQAQFCDEMARPVSFRDSQSFRWITVLFSGIPSILPLIAIYVTWKATSFGDQIIPRAVTAGWPVVVFYCCWLLYLVVATGVPSYFFHPREVPVQQQNRAIALSYYACGPLAISVLPSLTWVTSLLCGTAYEKAFLFFALLTFGLCFGQIAAWWLDLIHLTRRLVPQKPQRAVCLAVCVPILWFLLALAILVGLPLIVLYVIIIFASLS